MGYRYLGSKARVVEEIMELVGPPDDFNGRFIDAFCGTGIVASGAADLGWAVHINDMMLNATIMSESRLLSVKDVSFDLFGGYQGALDILNDLPGREGFITREYSPASEQYGECRKYFTVENAMKIDAISQTIHSWYADEKISGKEKRLLLSDLISSANNVANIAGTYGCFLSKWTSASQNKLVLSPRSLRQKHVNYSISNKDVFDLQSKPDDVVYFDPPYTKRQYASYYHIPETLCAGDCPTVEGVSGLRPWKNRASVFCYKLKAMDALVSLVEKQNAKVCYISYSDDGHVDLEPFINRLEGSGTVFVHQLGAISRYNSHSIDESGKKNVCEYLIEYQRH